MRADLAKRYQVQWETSWQAKRANSMYDYHTNIYRTNIYWSDRMHDRPAEQANRR